MKTSKLFSFCGALALCGSMAFAYPTLYSGTGIVATPTAEVTPQNQIEFAADYYNTEDKTIYPLRLQYGVAKNAEIGVNYNADQRYDLNGAEGVVGKYVVPTKWANVAGGVGYQQVNAGDNDGQATKIFAVATTKIPFDYVPNLAAKGDLGLNWTTRNTDNSDNDGSGVRVTIGGEATYMDKLSLVGEYESKLNSFNHAITSLAVRYQIIPQVAAQIGYTNADELYTAADAHRFTFGVDANYDLK